jgi:hypothetical protein
MIRAALAFILAFCAGGNAALYLHTDRWHLPQTLAAALVFSVLAVLCGLKAVRK